MNHFDSRQDSQTKKWHYTCRNGPSIWAVGKCDEDGGHKTAEEARACYRAFLIEDAVLNVKVAPAGKCVAAGCKQVTETAAIVANQYFRLCKEHMGHKTLDTVFPAVGSILSS